MPKGGDFNNDAKWSMRYWGGAGVLAFAFSLWCVWDGWFSGHDAATLNRIMAPIAFCVAVWLVWQGVKESRQIREQAAREQAGTAEPAADEVGQSADATAEDTIDGR